MRTLVIIPAYNESGNIENVINDLKTHFPQADRIVINDCSTDNTVDILKKLGESYISLPVNLGIGGGVQTGYIYARENNYDIAIQFDGDGQHDASYLNSLVAPIENGEADAVIGSRFVENEGFQSSAMRRTGIKFLSHLIKRLCHVDVKDVTSGMRAVNAKLISVFADNYAQDYPEPEALLTSGLCKARTLEIPVKMRERQSGKSSIKPLNSIYYMIKVTLALVLNSIILRKEKPNDF